MKRRSPAMIDPGGRISLGRWLLGFSGETVWVLITDTEIRISLVQRSGYIPRSLTKRGYPKLYLTGPLRELAIACGWRRSYPLRVTVGWEDGELVIEEDLH